MATNIAKLAILMTVDSSGMVSGLAQSQNQIRSFDNHIRQGSASVSNMDRGMGALGRSIQKGTLDAKGLALAFGGPVGVALSIGAAVTVAKRLFDHMLAVREEMQSAALQAQRDWEEAAAAVGKFQGEFTDTTNTFNQQMSRAWKEQGAFMSAYFDELLNNWKHMASLAATGLAMRTESLGFDSFAGEQARIKAKKAETAENEKQAKMQADLARDRTKELEQLANRANSLTKSMRTPAEVYVESLREIGDLLAKNAITIATAFRATTAAKADLVNAAKIAVDFKKVSDVRVGAVERGTAAAHSLAVSRDYQQLRMARVQQLQLAAEQKAVALLEEIKRLQSRQAPPSVVLRPTSF